MPKKKAKKVEEFVPETKEVEPGVFQTSTSNVNYVFEKPIEPLGGSPDLGREDLNQAFKNVHDKINEILKKVN